MKAIILTAVLLMICMSVTPLASYKNLKSNSAIKEAVSVLKNDTAIKDTTFRIKLKSGEIKKISADEYITGVVCGEMSPLCEKEALKAQAVAAYTFALKRKSNAQNRDYDLTESPESDQCYLEKSALKEKWGENFTEYYNNVSLAVKEVSGKYLTFENKPALCVYHAASSGTTNSSKDVWGNELPYLVSVESAGDKLYKNLITEKEITFKEITEKLKTESAEITDLKTNENGYVKSVNVSGKSFTGEEIRKALGLKSATFTFEKGEEKYIFCIKGSGHGVGMSQTGAQYMAQQGSNFEEILSYYYKGLKLEG